METFLNFALRFFDMVLLLTRLENEKLQSRISSWNISSSLSFSVGWGFIILFLVHVLSLAHYFSFRNSFVDAALQLLLCGVMSSSIALTSSLFNSDKARQLKRTARRSFESNSRDVCWLCQSLTDTEVTRISISVKLNRINSIFSSPHYCVPKTYSVRGRIEIFDWVA